MWCAYDPSSRKSPLSLPVTVWGHDPIGIRPSFPSPPAVCGALRAGKEEEALPGPPSPSNIIPPVCILLIRTSLTMGEIERIPQAVPRRGKEWLSRGKETGERETLRILPGKIPLDRRTEGILWKDDITQLIPKNAAHPDAAKLFTVFAMTKRRAGTDLEDRPAPVP